MTVLLYVSTIILTVVAVICALIFLWINNFSIRADVNPRNKSLKTMMKLSLVFAMITALLTGLLSNADAVEQSINDTVTLYFVIAISMLVVILFSCVVLMYRLITRRAYSEKTSFGVAQVIRVAAAGATISLILAWLLS